MNAVGEATRMRIVFVLGFLLTSAAGTAAGEYYIVQNSSTKQCTIVDSPPATTEVVLIDMAESSPIEMKPRARWRHSPCVLREQPQPAHRHCPRKRKQSNRNAGRVLKSPLSRNVKSLSHAARHYNATPTSAARQCTLNPLPRDALSRILDLLSYRIHFHHFSRCSVN